MAQQLYYSPSLLIKNALLQWYIIYSKAPKKVGYLEKGRGVFLWVLLFFFSFPHEVYEWRKQKRKQLNVLTLTDWLNRVKKG